jgi:soluble lytic murein transglycosylase-like protein
MKIKNYLKKALIMGGLVLAEGIYSTYNSVGYSPSGESNLERVKKQYETYEKSKLEEKISESFYLTPDSLNACIKQAYAEVKKWPKEFDKRLFRIMLQQESGYNVYAKSWAGALGISQIMPDTYETFRSKKFETFKNPADGSIDTLALEKELFNPVTNIGLSLETLNYLSNFCRKYHPSWDTLNLEDKRKTILSCYNAGPGIIKKRANWDLKSKKLKKEQKEYADIIMEAYYNPQIKIKLD